MFFISFLRCNDSNFILIFLFPIPTVNRNTAQSNDNFNGEFDVMEKCAALFGIALSCSGQYHRFRKRETSSGSNASKFESSQQFGHI